LKFWFLLRVREFPEILEIAELERLCNEITSTGFSHKITKRVDIIDAKTFIILFDSELLNVS
jgi:hypothetical protein